MAKKNDSKPFQITQNHIWIILIGLCGWYFSNLNDDSSSSEQQQFQLTLTVEKLTGIVERLQSDVTYLRDEIRNRTQDRFSRTEQEVFSKNMESNFDIIERKDAALSEEIRKIHLRLDALEK